MHERERWQIIKAMLRRARAGADRRRPQGDRRVGSLGAPRFREARRNAASRCACAAASRRPRPVAAGEGGYDPRTFEASSVLNIARQAGDRARRGRSVRRRRIDHHQRRHDDVRDGRSILRDRRLKVLTNSYPLAEVLIRDSQCRVALPGGEVYREEKLIVSPFEDDATQHYSAARMFMSAISVGELGVIEGHPLIARAGAQAAGARARTDRAGRFAPNSRRAAGWSSARCRAWRA